MAESTNQEIKTQPAKSRHIRREAPRFFNRELSWIEFNARVLHEALRRELPPVERLKFIAIAASNFDEFFQVRVAAIKRLAHSDPHTADKSGLTPAAVLKKISIRCHQLVRTQYACMSDDVLPLLAKNGIVYTAAKDYSTQQRSYTANLFKNEIYPLLTPLRTDGAEFPVTGNLKVNAAFLLEQIPGINMENAAFIAPGAKELLALVQIPAGIPRVVWLPSNGDEKAFTTLDDIIILYGTQLFPGYHVKETLLFKVARDADFAVNEDAGDDFIQAMEDVLTQRQSSFAVRLIATNTSPVILGILQRRLALTDDDVYTINGLIDPSSLLDITKIEEAQHLQYPEWDNFPSPDFPAEGKHLWSTLRQHDVLLHVPYESYDPVIRMIRDAASDDKVLSIKMTLYRTSGDSPIVNALEEAARNGKQVTAFVELKARFDERRNISWASELEKAGVIVVYGIVNLKVHAKVLMIVRRESDRIRRYVHLSTGNYNPRTALAYSDMSLFTANDEIANDATVFFNIISGYSAIQTMRHLYMAPITMKSRLLEMIEREIKVSTPDNPGLIIAKMNSLAHEEIIEALYKASNAGVRIMLNVRGICMLIPGVKGMSENITVVSIIDRYLEHSRIFYFQNAGADELYLSSADWMPRNLDRRVELMFPVTDPDAARTVRETLLLYFQDNSHSHVLQSDGSWKPNVPSRNETEVRAQEILYKKYKKRADMQSKEIRTEFVVRRKD